MNKKIFSLAIFLIVQSSAFFGNTFQKGLSKTDPISYENHVNARLDLGIFEREYKEIFAFFDQNKIILPDLENHQESMYNILVLPMYKKCNGSYNRFVRVVKSANRGARTVFKCLKTAGCTDFTLIKKRQNQLKALLNLVRKKSSYVKLLWTAARIEDRYGYLMDKSLDFETEFEALDEVSSDQKKESVDTKREFEKELLYTLSSLFNFDSVSNPLHCFLRTYLNRDIKKCYKQYSRQFMQGDSTGFALKTLAHQYDKLNKIKIAIHDLEMYKKEKNKIFKALILGTTCLVTYIAILVNFPILLP
jgi:hypothetical protein